MWPFPPWTAESESGHVWTAKKAKAYSDRTVPVKTMTREGCQEPASVGKHTAVPSGLLRASQVVDFHGVGYLDGE